MGLFFCVAEREDLMRTLGSKKSPGAIFHERSEPAGQLILLGAKLNSCFIAGLKGELQDVIRKHMDVFCNPSISNHNISFHHRKTKAPSGAFVL